MLAKSKKMAWLASHPSCCHHRASVWLLLTHEAVVPRWLSVEPAIWVDMVSEEFLETQPGIHLGDQWDETSSLTATPKTIDLGCSEGRVGGGVGGRGD